MLAVVLLGTPTPRLAGAAPAKSAQHSSTARSSAGFDGCAASATAKASPFGVAASSGYRVVKSWDFVHSIRDDAALRAEFQTRYVYDSGRLDHLGDEWSRYRDDANHVFSARGLGLVAKVKGELAPGQIESGMLRSRWSGRYGVFEICMRAPEGRGLWPAFWLNPEDGRWPPEIDIVEIVTTTAACRIAAFTSFTARAKATSRRSFPHLDRYGAYAANPDFSHGFHAFSVEWTPTRVRHFVDGVLVADRAFRWLHDDGTDGGPAHVLVNLAVGGGNGRGRPGDASIFPATLSVAFMRVWQT